LLTTSKIHTVKSPIELFLKLLVKVVLFINYYY